MLTDEFLHEHFTLNGIGEQRQIEQTKALLEFEDFCGQLPVAEAGPEQIEKWMIHLLGTKKLAPNTVRWKINMVRPFYAWLQRRGHITRERLLLIRDVKYPRGSSSQSEPNPYDRKEILGFWRDLDEHRPTDLAYVRRWRRGTSGWSRVWKHAERIQIEAITMLALYCGLRRIEVRRVSIDDIDPLNEYVPVLGKGGDVRKVPFPESARNRVGTWLDFRQEIGPDHDYPWLTLGQYQMHRNNALPEKSLAEMFGRIGGGYELHRLRHTCATEWLRAGMPLEQVRDIMGHSNLDQTLAYAKIVPDDAKRSMDRYERVFQRKIEPDLEPPSDQEVA